MLPSADVRFGLLAEQRELAMSALPLKADMLNMGTDVR